MKHYANQMLFFFFLGQKTECYYFNKCYPKERFGQVFLCTKPIRIITIYPILATSQVDVTRTEKEKKKKKLLLNLVE